MRRPHVKRLNWLLQPPRPQTPRRTAWPPDHGHGPQAGRSPKCWLVAVVAAEVMVWARKEPPQAAAVTWKPPLLEMLPGRQRPSFLLLRHCRQRRLMHHCRHHQQNRRCSAAWRPPLSHRHQAPPPMMRSERMAADVQASLTPHHQHWRLQLRRRRPPEPTQMPPPRPGSRHHHLRCCQRRRCQRRRQCLSPLCGSWPQPPCRWDDAPCPAAQQGRHHRHHA